MYYLILLLPFLFTFLSLPSVIILDKFFLKRKNYVFKFARKLGIPEDIDLLKAVIYGE